mgnify:CR=1 FL=1
MQVGGDHYKSDYQHWDFVCDTGLHYLLACATKYISRWRKKNGIEDLKKSLHYINKAESRAIKPPATIAMIECGERFANQHEDPMDLRLLRFVNIGDYYGAKKYINTMIYLYETRVSLTPPIEGSSEPGSTYTNPDI